MLTVIACAIAVIAISFEVGRRIGYHNGIMRMTRARVDATRQKDNENLKQNN